MRTIQRNKRLVAYARYEGVTEILDDNGDHTGQYEVHYTDPVYARMNVSGGRGQADIALFGFTSNYSRTLVTDDLETDFNKQTIFWIETDPKTQPHDYRVAGVARTINQVVIALAEVDVSHEENPTPIVSG